MRKTVQSRTWWWGTEGENTLPERRAPLHDYPVYNPAHMPRERLFGAGGGGWGRNKARPPSWNRMQSDAPLFFLSEKQTSSDGSSLVLYRDQYRVRFPALPLYSVPLPTRCLLGLKQDLSLPHPTRHQCWAKVPSLANFHFLDVTPTALPLWINNNLGQRAGTDHVGLPFAWQGFSVWLNILRLDSVLCDPCPLPTPLQERGTPSPFLYYVHTFSFVIVWARCPLVCMSLSRPLMQTNKSVRRLLCIGSCGDVTVGQDSTIIPADDGRPSPNVPYGLYQSGVNPFLELQRSPDFPSSEGINHQHALWGEILYLVLYLPGVFCLQPLYGI